MHACMHGPALPQVQQDSRKSMACLQAQAQCKEGETCAARQVFFLDSLKFFLSLYGHKLPVLTMDVSSDSSLLVSGSADKNIKIWGLDFGDCHRSLFAHGDSIMQVLMVFDFGILTCCILSRTQSLLARMPSIR